MPRSSGLSIEVAMKQNRLNKTWLTTGEAAEYLGRTTNAIWLLVSKGLLTKRKWNRRLYFKRSELDQLLESGFYLRG